MTDLNPWTEFNERYTRLHNRLESVGWWNVESGVYIPKLDYSSVELELKLYVTASDFMLDATLYAITGRTLTLIKFKTISVSDLPDMPTPEQVLDMLNGITVPMLGQAV